MGHCRLLRMYLFPGLPSHMHKSPDRFTQLRPKPVYYAIARELAPISVGIFRKVSGAHKQW